MADVHTPVRVTPFTPGHLYFDDPTFDAKIALKGRKTVCGQPYVVAHVNRPGSAADGDDKRYARLFCAAPDLLEALIRAEDALRTLHDHYVIEDHDHSVEGERAIIAAQNAIAKASSKGPADE